MRKPLSGVFRKLKTGHVSVQGHIRDERQKFSACRGNNQLGSLGRAAFDHLIAAAPECCSFPRKGFD
jgi:hypothetical protein